MHVSFCSIAIERDQYLRDKVENVETYKNALSAQVRFMYGLHMYMIVHVRTGTWL